MNWKYPAGAWIPFLIRGGGKEISTLFLGTRTAFGGFVKSSYAEKNTAV